MDQGVIYPDKTLIQKARTRRVETPSELCWDYRITALSVLKALVYDLNQNRPMDRQRNRPAKSPTELQH